MKITAEFNSNDELMSFISAFGARGAQLKQELAPVVDAKKTAKVETIKKEDKPAAQVKAEAQKEEIKEAEIAKETEIANEIEQDQKKDEEVKVTKEMVRKRLGAVMKAGKQTEAKELVAKHGATGIPTLKEEEYAAVYEEAEKLL